MLMGPWYILVELWNLLTPLTLLYVAVSTFIGIVIGMLPGLTATMGVALLTGLTFGFPPKQAILILICVYVGAIYGGSRSAILLNIPGTPANAATCLDGFPLAQKGEAGPAIGLATTSSFVGTVFGLLCLAFFTPLLGKIALEFQSWEFFWLAIFGIVVCGNLTAPTDPLKGWIAGFIGLLVSLVGQENIAAYPRFAFGSDQMRGGFALIPVLVGVYGIAEVLGVMRETVVPRVVIQIQKVLPRWQDLWQYRRTMLRSGVIGVIIGAIPGVGEDVAAWVSYDFAKRASKKPEEFGKGSREGLIAAETGNNACIGGAVIPVLSLAVPGSAPAAVLLAAMWLHGVRPGPLLMIEFPNYIWEVTAMFILASLAMLILGLSLVRTLVKILMVPRPILMPIVFVLCVIGSFAISVRIFDIWVMLAFGLLGYPMRKYNYPAAPLVLGVILGDMADVNFRRALIRTAGDVTPFFTRPISLVLVAITLFTILARAQWFRRMLVVGSSRVKASLSRG
ncbi:MAG: transporter [candidate division NC10 bacterium RIFCSPLOWO2_12_FULL_66_18]|nr:MAG: transporter [candidate division NC10 bacterium RIFCSPLOWO2_02_FULL_66_22]OGB98915.1 MAG: transporter [candidate division NC10 bacterium RIFCSPLOWO2_12_FULL_66_18]